MANRPRMHNAERLARAAFALTALVVLAGLIIQLHSTWNLPADAGFFKTRAGRVVNVFCFFTVQSNILVMITCGLLAVRLDRRSMVFRSLRLTGLLCITVTGIVFHLTLKDLQDLHGSAAVADNLLHTASPVLTVLGWLAFGPRRMITGRVILGAALFPLAWCAFALIRGPFYDYYPYPFVNVIDLGYARVLLNIVIIAVLFLGLATVARWLDGKLPRLH